MKKKMKILAFLVCCILLNDKLQAQSYQKLLYSNNEWDIFSDVVPVVNKNNMAYQSGSILANEDTSVGGFIYKKAFSRTEDLLTFGSKPCLIREDTVARKVYILSADSSNERILYDFSMVAGDSIYLDFRYNNSVMMVLHSGWYYVDSTGVINTLSGPRNTWYLSNPQITLPNPSNPQLTWIEGIGSVISPVYLDEEFTFSLGFVNVQASYFLSLVCAFHDSTIVFHDSLWNVIYTQGGWSFIGDSCIFNMMGGVADFSREQASLIVYPNPSTDETWVQLKDIYAGSDAQAEIIYTDLTGRVQQKLRYAVQDVMQGIPLKRNGLPPGIYFVNLLLDGKRVAAGKISLN